MYLMNRIKERRNKRRRELQRYFLFLLILFLFLFFIGSVCASDVNATYSSSTVDDVDEVDVEAVDFSTTIEKYNEDNLVDVSDSASNENNLSIKDSSDKLESVCNGNSVLGIIEENYNTNQIMENEDCEEHILLVDKNNCLSSSSFDSVQNILSASDNDILSSESISDVSTYSELVDAIAYPAFSKINIINDIDCSSVITIDRSVIIEGNGHTIDGKQLTRIFNVSGDDVVVKNITFVNGFADSTNDGGGAILWSGNGGQLIDSIFVNNSAKNGGAILLSGASGNISGCNFTGNNVSTGDGGAIFVLGNNCIIEHSIFTKNSAPNNDGGAVSVENAVSNMNIINDTFINNTVKHNGGAINMESGVINVYNSSFVNNSAIHNGGAIYLGNVNSTFYNCTFCNNNVGISGGAIYNNNNGQCTLNNCIFDNNHANDAGAGIFGGCDSYLEGCSFKSNTARHSSCFFSASSSFNIKNSIFVNNVDKTYSSMGAYESSINISNSCIYNNTGSPVSDFGSNTFILNNNWWGDNLGVSEDVDPLNVKSEFVTLTTVNGEDCFIFKSIFYKKSDSSHPVDISWSRPFTNNNNVGGSNFWGYYGGWQ